MAEMRRGGTYGFGQGSTPNRRTPLLRCGLATRADQLCLPLLFKGPLEHGHGGGLWLATAALRLNRLCGHGLRPREQGPLRLVQERLLPLDGQRTLELLRHQLEGVGLKGAAVGCGHHPDGLRLADAPGPERGPASCPFPDSHQGSKCPGQACSPWPWSYPTRVSAFGGPSSIPACRLRPGMAVPSACSWAIYAWYRRTSPVDKATAAGASGMTAMPGSENWSLWAISGESHRLSTTRARVGARPPILAPKRQRA